MSEKLTATWSISLDTECPACKEDVDLLTADDFWEYHQSLQLCENRSERSENVRVWCPKCGHMFNVDLEY